MFRTEYVTGKLDLALGSAVFSAGVGSHSRSFCHLFLYVFSGPSCRLGGFFIHFLSFCISPAPISYRNTLASLNFILASPNLSQSIEHGRISGKVYHIDRAICYRSGDIAVQSLASRACEEREPPYPFPLPRKGNCITFSDYSDNFCAD